MTIQAIAAAALSTASGRAASAAEGVRRAGEPQVEDSVSLSEQAVRLLKAHTEYEAAIELARTADEIQRSAVDLLA
ncbi:MAG: hypothetical protein R2748_26225 [Bryobacterales bacterium]